MSAGNNQPCKKVKFRSEGACNEFIKKKKRTSINSKPAESYLCPKCMSWHVTSNVDQTRDRLELAHKEIKNKNKLIHELNTRIHDLKMEIGNLKHGVVFCNDKNI